MIKKLFKYIYADEIRQLYKTHKEQENLLKQTGDFFQQTVVRISKEFAKSTAETRDFYIKEIEFERAFLLNKILEQIKNIEDHTQSQPDSEGWMDILGSVQEIKNILGVKND